MNSQSDVKINYNNLVEMQEDACSKFSQNPIFGTKNGGAFEWITYAEFAEKVDQFRGGLATLGVGKDAAPCRSPPSLFTSWPDKSEPPSKVIQPARSIR